jgi:AraC family transcriptional regulator
MDVGGFELAYGLRRRDPLVERIGLSLKAELEGAGLLGGRLYAEALANQLAVALLREHSSLGRRQRRAVERGPSRGLPERALGLVRDYVGDNLAGDLSLGRMARVASVSPHHFARSFKESTGLTPHQYVIVQRVERAKDLLLRGLPVGEVAGACGFSDQSHLARHFKRLYGVTPKAFALR